MFSPLDKNTQPERYLLKRHSASADSFTKIPITFLYRKKVFSSNLSFYSQFGNTFSLVQTTLVSAGRWFSGQESMNMLKKPLCAQATERRCHRGILPPLPVTLHEAVHTYPSRRNKARRVQAGLATVPSNGKSHPDDVSVHLLNNTTRCMFYFMPNFRGGTQKPPKPNTNLFQ